VDEKVNWVKEDNEHAYHRKTPGHPFHPGSQLRIRATGASEIASETSKQDNALCPMSLIFPNACGMESYLLAHRIFAIPLIQLHKARSLPNNYRLGFNFVSMG
jgi:hypothetical protein